MADLTTDVRYIKGIGEKKAQALNKLGVFSLYDLISYFPRRYEDRSEYRPIAQTTADEPVCIRAIVADTPRLVRIRRGMELVKLRAVDESASVDITYFNQNYVKDQLVRGETYIFYGRVEIRGGRRSMVNPVHEKEGAENGVTGRIIPVYRLCAGLSQRVMIQSMQQGLAACAGMAPDVLPESVRRRCELVQANYAYENIHFPPDFTALELARRRLIFEELFVLAAALGMMRTERSREGGIRLDECNFEEFYSALPFSPTGAQRRAVSEAAADMRSGGVMNRLLQGDVGSGKTLVAAALIWQTWKSGRMSAFMAPTEILAEQHYVNLSAMLEPFGLRVGKLTGAMSAKEKRAAKAALADGEYDLIVGTHALFSADVEYSIRLALVVTDEQHRFGVNQRSALISKGARPHVLVMSATPIPRTLSLLMYGDLELSVIDELPPGRKPIKTRIVPQEKRDDMYRFIENELKDGAQCYAVCPLVEESEAMEGVLSAAALYKELSKKLDVSIELMHGRLSAAEKQARAARFASGETKLLVSTTVVEVGVDVPNATIMVIENADRFGLAQLHQLRGRVGRGSKESYCFLLSESDSKTAKERLSILCSTTDGFKIAERDLEMRGPGELIGARQHGEDGLSAAMFASNMKAFNMAKDAADKLIAKGDMNDSLIKKAVITADEKTKNIAQN